MPSAAAVVIELTPPLPALNRDHRFAHFERGAAALNGLGQLLPHLAGTVQRIAKAIDQGLDDRAVPLAESKRTLNQYAHREVLDPLGRPVGADLTARDTPDFLGVAAKEGLVQPPPEGVDHPVLEAANFALRPNASRHVAQHAGGRLEQAELAQRVPGLERIFEKAASIIDAREPFALEHPVAQDVAPELFDLGVLGKEAVTADVEAKSLVADGAGDAADVLRILFDDHHRPPGCRKLVRRGQAGRTCPDYDGRVSRADGSRYCRAEVRPSFCSVRSWSREFSLRR